LKKSDVGQQLHDDIPIAEVEIIVFKVANTRYNVIEADTVEDVPRMR